MTPVLVTGATGFVGRALTEALIAQGRPVIAMTRRYAEDLGQGAIQRVTGPIESLDREGWLEALDGAGTVIHTAGIAHAGPGIADTIYDTVNRRATATLAEAAAMARIRRIVFFSSIRAQTGASAERPITEQTTAAPQDAYGRSKLAAEQALAMAAVDRVILRPVVIVGPEPKGNIAALVRLAQSPLPLPLGGITAQRSLVALGDVVGAAVRGLDDPAMAGGTFILADPQPMTIGAMIARLREGMGRPPGLFNVPEAFLGGFARLAGQAQAWQRIAEPLVARPEALSALGFRFAHGAEAALRDLGRRSLRHPPQAPAPRSG